MNYLNMKSNCENASMTTPRKVENAPCMTGANMCSNANIVLLFLSPRLPTKLCNRNKSMTVLRYRALCSS